MSEFHEKSAAPLTYGSPGIDRGLPYEAHHPARNANQDTGAAQSGIVATTPAGQVGYRREIDGLRAIAVVLVILYHSGLRVAGLDPFAGGFIGVDVFFVISGYLIGSIVQREVMDGTFSFANFYERRARRILPALYTVLAVTIPFAWLYMLPSAFRDYSASLLATVFSASNLYFWHVASYDAADNLFRPLIHTWSLGVEEQFYVIFPCFLLLVWKFSRKFLTAILCIGLVVSFILAEWMTRHFPDASFFLLPPRIWELGLGVFLARRELTGGRLVSMRSSRVAPAVGLALLICAVPLMRPQWHHPGLVTLIPVAGTALLIWYTGHGDPITRALSSQPFVFVGLISYSLYLWHQPIFAFGRMSATDSVGGMMVFFWILMSVILAIATYRFVEIPTRSRKRTSKHVIWLIASLGAVLLSGGGYYWYVQNGLPSRFADGLAPIAAASDIREAQIFQNGKSCLNFAPEQGPCTFHGSNPEGYALVSLGDSHARTLLGPMRDSLDDYRDIASFTPLNRGGCVFLLGLQRVDVDQPGCPGDYNDKRLDYIGRLKRPIAVLLWRLPILVEQSRYNNGEGGIEPGDDHPHLAKLGETGPADPAAVATAISRTINTLLERGVKVVLVYPVPEMGWNVPQVLLMRARRQNDPAAYMQADPISVSYGDFRRRTQRTYALYDNVGSDPNLVRVYPEKAFCDQQRCFANRGSQIFYRDDNHLSETGASKLNVLIMDAIKARWGNDR
ncbi:acyltransferase family protein [Mesorhizobium sp. ORM16]|uniref:acyltransferase family protein n=1 Tax=Mesorhizobium sp. ORM16 TaxID=3376989 RepID=UPI003857EDEA